LQAYSGFPVAFEPFLMTWSAWQSGQWRMTCSSVFQKCSLNPCIHATTQVPGLPDYRSRIEICEF
jgi:hypothetical protein